jgi:predicted methyltransferase
VWTLPPTYRLGALDHDKYAKVGKADNFLLKFRKVGGRSSFHAAQL